MNMKQVPSDVSADVLIHNFGKKPNPEAKAKMLAFIDAHKDETMKMTKDSLPSPEEELRREYGRFAARNAILDRDEDDSSEDSSSGGTASPSS
jgi:hypothetical protein